jgi:hypothetical protein
MIASLVISKRLYYCSSRDHKDGLVCSRIQLHINVCNAILCWFLNIAWEVFPCYWSIWRMCCIITMHGCVSHINAYRSLHICLQTFNLLFGAIFLPPCLRERERSCKTMIPIPLLIIWSCVCFTSHALLLLVLIKSKYKNNLPIYLILI